MLFIQGFLECGNIHIKNEMNHGLTERDGSYLSVNMCDVLDPPGHFAHLISNPHNEYAIFLTRNRCPENLRDVIHLVNSAAEIQVHDLSGNF